MNFKFLKKIVFMSSAFILITSCNDEKIISKIEDNKTLISKNETLLKSFILDNSNRLEFLGAISKSLNEEDTVVPETLLNIDCTNKKVQAFHLDLVNQFGILGKINTQSNSPNIIDINFIIKEIDGKSRYDLISAAYEKTTTSAKGIKTHHFKLLVNKGNLANSYIPVNLGTLKKMKKGDQIDIHIKSDDAPEIRSKSDKSNLDYWTDFGNKFCRGVVTAP